MAFTLGRYGSRNNLNLQMFDFATNKPMMYFDYATTTTNEWTGETVYARGGDGNPKRISWNGDKDSTLTVETQVFTLQHLAMLAGESIKKGAKNIYKTEVVTVMDDGSGGKMITLKKTPYGNIANIAVFAFVNGIDGDPQPVASIANKDVILDPTATVNIGEDVEVYYQATVADTASLSFTAKGFPGYVKIVGDTLFPDEMSGEIMSVQQIFYKARLQPNFSLAMSPTGDPTTLSLTFDIFPIKVDGVDTLMDMIVYDDND